MYVNMYLQCMKRQQITKYFEEYCLENPVTYLTVDSSQTRPAGYEGERHMETWNICPERDIAVSCRLDHNYLGADAAHDNSARLWLKIVTVIRHWQELQTAKMVRFLSGSFVLFASLWQCLFSCIWWKLYTPQTSGFQGLSVGVAWTR